MLGNVSGDEENWAAQAYVGWAFDVGLAWAADVRRIAREWKVQGLFDSGVEAGRKREREACAVMALRGDYSDAEDLAAAIRARGGK